MVKKKRSQFEVVIVVIVIVLTLALGIGIYSGRAKVNKSRLLIQELSMFRSSVTLFQMINRKVPKSLDELANSSYEVDSTMRPYVEFLHRSGDGVIIDPFGNPYSYDPKGGWVASTTSGYLRW